MILPVYSCRYASQVVGHLQYTVDYYDQISPDLGSSFLDEFGIQVSKICDNPYAHAIRYDDVRFALIKRFHYAIQYVINEPSKEIIVFAVHSTHMNPDTKWKKPDSME